MPAQRGEIGLGDLLRALSSSPGDPDTRRVVAEMIGFAPPAEVAVATPIDTEEHPRRHEPRPQRQPRVTPGREAARGPVESELPLLAATGKRTIGRMVVAPIQSLARDRPPETADPAPVFRPLLPPTEARDRVVALASRERAVGPIDIAELVRSIALLRPSTEVPRLKRLRLRSEVWFIADESMVMTPFREDQEHLLELLVRMIGDGAVTVRYVFGDPGAALVDEMGRRSVPTDVFVLAFSDFGAGENRTQVRDAYADAWVGLAATLGRAHSEIVGVTPYPPSRWPPQCRRAFRMVQLDRRVERPTAEPAS